MADTFIFLDSPNLLDDFLLDLEIFYKIEVISFN
jgi:hypothetical protein